MKALIVLSVLLVVFGVFFFAKLVKQQQNFSAELRQDNCHS